MTFEEILGKYSGASGGAIHDPQLKAIGDRLFTGDRRKWPFEGIRTFLDAPFDPDAARILLAGETIDTIDVALVGVPMDLGVTNRAGARLGPKAVRQVERVGPYNRVLGLAPVTEVRVADLGDVPMRSRFSLEDCHADICSYFTAIGRSGIVPLSVGGDHSISYSILKGLAESHGPMGMVHIDAHCDTAGIYEGAKFHHGGPFRLAVLDGVLDPKRTIQIGIRGGGDYLWEFSYDSGMTVVHAEEVQEIGLQAVIDKALDVVGGGATYVSFDVDSLDPAFTPGTGTPEVGGLQPREALALLRGISGIDIVGGDVVEVAPAYDPTTNTAQIGAQMLFELLCLAARNSKIRNRETLAGQ